MAGKLPGRALDPNTAVTISGATVNGHLMPSANVTYDIGNSAMRWRDLWLSGTTINLGGATIKTDTGTGAIALIPKPTVATPNPVAMVVSPAGRISTVATTDGVPAANAVSEAAAANTNVDAATLQGNSVTDILTSANAVASNADNITSGTLNNSRLPVNITGKATFATLAVDISNNIIAVGSNVSLNTSTLFIGNSTVNTVVGPATITLNGVNVNTAITSNAATAYANATAYADTKAGEAFSNAASRADSAYSNAVAYAASNTYVNQTFLPLAGGTVTGGITVSNTLSTGNTTINGFVNVSSNLTVSSIAAFGNDVTITGNLIVSGTRIFANTTTVDLSDNIITLNADIGAVAPSENAGLEVHRGSSANVLFVWNETIDKWTFTTDGTNYVTVASNNDVSTAYSNAIAYSGNAALAYANAVAYAASNTYVNSTFAPLSGATFTGAVSGITTLAAGNTTITGFANVSSTLEVGGNTHASGQVLIGTATSTGYGLSSGYMLGLQSGGTQTFLSIGKSGQTLDTDGMIIGMDTTGGAIYVRPNQPLDLYTNNTLKARLAANGNLGIGTTSPSSKLSVQGDGLTVRLDGTANISRGIFLRNTGTGEGIFQTDGNMHFLQEDASRYMRFSTANTERMRIASNGFIGFDTTNPTNKFHVSGGADDGRVAITNNDRGNGYANGFWIGVDSAQSYLLSRDSYPLTFFTNATKRMTIDENGNVYTEVGSAISYGSGETYQIWNSDDEYSIAHSDANWKDMKTFVCSKSGNLKFKFSAYISSGTYYWAWRILKNGSTVAASGYFENPDAGETASVHAYRRFVASVGPIAAGDSLVLQMSSSSGDGTPATGVGQTLYAKEFRAYSTVPNVEHGGSNNIWGARVGIGTTGPTVKLFVASSESGYTANLAESVTKSTVLFKTHSSDSTVTSFGGISGGAAFIQRSNGGGTTAYDLCLNPFGGNVGIGTTSPTQKLHVNGLVRASEFVGSNTTWYLIPDDTSYLKEAYWTTNPASGTYLYTYPTYLQAVNSSTGRTFAFDTGTGNSYINLGNLGIGTTSPTDKLVVDSTTADSYIRMNSSNVGNTGIKISYNGGNSHGIDLLYYPNNAQCFFDSKYQVNAGTVYGDIYFRQNVAGTMTTRMTIKADGGSVIIAGTLTENSSITLKENVNPITNAIDTISKLVGVTYDRKDGSATQRPGLIAEEVDKILPNIVIKDENGTPSSIAYTNLIAYLVESIKELKAEIDVLKGG